MRVVVITGGGSGIGAAVAKAFAELGDLVYILGRHEEKLKKTAANQSHMFPMVADVTDTKSVEKVKNAITGQHDHVHILVNCAGGNTKVDPKASLSDAAKGWDFVLDVNLKGTFLVTHAFLPSIARPGGRIINISSQAALAGSSLGGVTGQAYAAAKSGVHGMSRTLSKMLAHEGITVNSVAPGVVDDTGFFGGKGIPADRKDMYLTNIPVNRLGKPRDIAAGVVYLASDEASFVTGEILNINGGAVFGR